ncbi:TenA family protein [Marinobacterium lutimaris]|uniref:Aminopyrimidine aminohydrolase n=1 Tax=Marinobacterium lutimaris TaxID=568106 RepID=A0A1H6DJH3_9GAMM|nr:TenA family protein [Marinobacterium lutimaris]SEG84983.1 thiaminase (transcriptional activator TenA) [Marinobacterium lutimaris]
MSFSDYQQQHPSLPLSEQLRGYAGSDWQQAVSHPFTEALGQDQLDDAVYARYLVQDYAFIDTLVNLVARTIANAPAMPPKTVLAGFLAALTSDENTYFLRSFEALGLSEEQYLNPELHPVSQAIIDTMQASEQSYEQAIICLCVAEWSYLSWSKTQAAKPRGSRFYLQEWIDIHVLPEFEQFVAWLRGQVDSFDDRDNETLEQLAELFCRMARLEHQFFSASLDPTSINVLRSCPHVPV